MRAGASFRKVDCGGPPASLTSSFGNGMKRIAISLLVTFLAGILLVGWAMFGDRSSFQAGLNSYMPSTFRPTEELRLGH
jgi:hypothetical protein